MTFATLRGVTSIAAIGIRKIGGFGLVYGGGSLCSIHFAAFMRRDWGAQRLLLYNRMQRATARADLIWMRRRVGRASAS